MLISLFIFLSAYLGDHSMYPESSSKMSGRILFPICAKLRALVNFAHQLEMQCQLINLGSFNCRLRNNWRDPEKKVFNWWQRNNWRDFEEIVLTGGREIIGEILKK